MNKKLANLKKVHPTLTIQAEPVFFVNGKTLVTKAYIAKDMKVSERHISNWEKAGFEASEYSLPRMKLYDINALKAWHLINIDQSQSRKIKGSGTVHGNNQGRPLGGVDLSSVDAEEADRLKKINDVMIGELKIKEAKGDLVRADTTDKAIAEFGSFFVGFLRNSRITLSRDLENKDKDYIFSFLDTHYGEFVDDVHKRVNHIQSEESETIYDFLHETLLDYDGVREHIIKVIGSKKAASIDDR